MPRDFEPTCRYHPNVELFQVKKPFPEWYIPSYKDQTNFFVGHIFTCPLCGYTEFFDNEPDRTLLFETSKDGA